MNPQSMAALIAEQARRDREAAQTLGAMLHKYELTPEECRAIGTARAVLDVNAREVDFKARELLREEQQGVRT